MFQRVDFTDGSFVCVAIPLARHGLLSAYRQEFRSLLDGIDYWMPSMDASLFEAWGAYYRKIGELLEPAIDVEQMTSASRHSFFVCTEPVANPMQPDTLIAGLPQLDQLLGMSLPSPAKRHAADTGQVGVSSGDATIDLLADLLLFKTEALPLADRYGFAFLNKLVVQTAQRRDPEVQKKLQAEADKKRFEQLNAGAAVREYYKRQGIPIPEDF